MVIVSKYIAKEDVVSMIHIEVPTNLQFPSFSFLFFKNVENSSMKSIALLVIAIHVYVEDKKIFIINDYFCSLCSRWEYQMQKR